MSPDSGGTGDGAQPAPFAVDPQLGLPGIVPDEAELGREEPVRSLADDLRDLASDAQTVFDAEKAFQSARLSYALSRGRDVALRFVLAAGVAYFALVALVVGLLLALAPLITAWGALAVVTLSLLILAFFFYKTATTRLRRMRVNLAGRAGDMADSGAGR